MTNHTKIFNLQLSYSYSLTSQFQLKTRFINFSIPTHKEMNDDHWIPSSSTVCLLWDIALIWGILIPIRMIIELYPWNKSKSSILLSKLSELKVLRVKVDDSCKYAYKTTHFDALKLFRCQGNPKWIIPSGHHSPCPHMKLFLSLKFSELKFLAAQALTIDACRTWRATY